MTKTPNITTTSSSKHHIQNALESQNKNKKATLLKDLLGTTSVHVYSKATQGPTNSSNAQTLGTHGVRCIHKTHLILFSWFHFNQCFLHEFISDFSDLSPKSVTLNATIKNVKDCLMPRKVQSAHWTHPHCGALLLPRRDGTAREVTHLWTLLRWQQTIRCTELMVPRLVFRFKR